MSKTKAEMRIEIAKDVLKAMETRRFIAEYEGYLTHDDTTERELAYAVHQAHWDQDSDALLQPFSKREYVAPDGCRVCAIGAVFVATVDRHDSLSLAKVYGEQGLNSKKMLGYLEEWFEIEQMRLMEAAYEGGPQGTGEEWDVSLEEEEIEQAEAFYENNGPGGGERMTAIMNNIIENNGTFCP